MSKQVITIAENEDYRGYLEGPGKYVFKYLDGAVAKVVTVTGEGKTDQSFKDLVSVKSLVARTEAKGLLRASQKFEGTMDDYPNLDYQEAQFALAEAKSVFEAMPSKLRKQFGNDPIAFAEFVQNPENQKNLVDMGLAKLKDGYDKFGNITQEEITRRAEEKVEKDDQTNQTSAE